MRRHWRLHLRRIGIISQYPESAHLNFSIQLPDDSGGAVSPCHATPYRLQGHGSCLYETHWFFWPLPPRRLKIPGSSPDGRVHKDSIVAQVTIMTSHQSSIHKDAVGSGRSDCGTMEIGVLSGMVDLSPCVVPHAVETERDPARIQLSTQSKAASEWNPQPRRSVSHLSCCRPHVHLFASESR